jgi:sugar phosphate isomerase/epimerase
MAELAISTWSLHRALGPVYPDLALSDGERRAEDRYGAGELSLLEAPAAVAARGIMGLEVCHFHFPRTDADYLGELRGRLDAAGVRPLTLLLDAGDLTAPDAATRQRDLARLKGWVDVAARLGARQVRAIAGDARPGGEAIGWSIAGLGELAGYAKERGVGVITENWRQLALRPADLLAILDGLDGAVGLCADFGNYRGPGKYDDLRAILPRAGSIHAKAEFPRAGELEREDFTRCLDLAREAGFAGPYVLIFDGPGDEWASLDQMAGVVRPYL